MRRSQEVDNKIKDCWAKLAKECFKGAMSSVDFGNMAHAEQKMDFVEKWLEKAGAKATRWNF